MDSEQLIDFASIRSGDQNAFRAFFDLYYPRVKALGCRFVDEHTAEDLTQDVFVQIWVLRESIEPANIGSYLYKAIQNRCLNRIKHSAVVNNYSASLTIAQQRVAYLQARADECGCDVWNFAEQHNLRELIETAIRKLPPKCAEAFRLAYLENRSNKEVAEDMKLSVRTVETHIYKALMLLRGELKGLYAVLLVLLSIPRETPPL